MDDRDKERAVVEVTHRVMDDYARDPRKVSSRRCSTRSTRSASGFAPRRTKPA